MDEPIAVPWICRKCSLLKEKEFLFSMIVKMLKMECSTSRLIVFYFFNIQYQCRL